MTSQRSPRAAAVRPQRVGDGVDLDEAPLILIWEATRACALACTHCRASAMRGPLPGELTTREAKDLLSDAAAMGTRLFVFSGGDPLERTDLEHLIEHAGTVGLRSMVSPAVGSLCTVERLRSLQGAGASGLSLSIDGMPATHDRLRGYEGCWNQSFAVLSAALEDGLQVQINTAVTPETKPDLPSLAAVLSDYRLLRWSLFFLVPTGRGIQVEPLTAQDHESVYRWLAGFRKQAPFPVKTTKGPAFRRVLLEGAGWQRDGEGLAEPGRAGVPGMLRATVGGRRRWTGINDGRGFCFVNYQGDIQPSGFLPVTAGNVREDDLADVYRNSALFRGLRDPDRLTGRCGDCPFRAICGGSRARTYALTGELWAEEPTCIYHPGAPSEVSVS